MSFLFESLGLFFYIYEEVNSLNCIYLLRFQFKVDLNLSVVFLFTPPALRHIQMLLV